MSHPLINHIRTPCRPFFRATTDSRPSLTSRHRPYPHIPSSARKGGSLTLIATSRLLARGRCNILLLAATTMGPMVPNTSRSRRCMRHTSFLRRSALIKPPSLAERGPRRSVAADIWRAPQYCPSRSGADTSMPHPFHHTGSYWPAQICLSQAPDPRLGHDPIPRPCRGDRLRLPAGRQFVPLGEHKALELGARRWT